MDGERVPLEREISAAERDSVRERGMRFRESGTPLPSKRGSGERVRQHNRLLNLRTPRVTLAAFGFLPR